MTHYAQLIRGMSRDTTIPTGYVTSGAFHRITANIAWLDVSRAVDAIEGGVDDHLENASVIVTAKVRSSYEVA